MKRRRAILHIGTEKAGSTTLQAVMAANRAVLLDNGFAYPLTPGEQNHFRLALFAGEDRHTKGLARKEERAGAAADIDAWFPEQLTEEIGRLPAHVHSIVLSNEHCHSRLITNESVQRLHALLAPLFETFEIIIYLRRQDELAVSRYSTALRTGNASGEIFPRRLEGKARLYFDYAALLDRWVSAFGQTAVRPRLFGHEHFAGGDLVQDWRIACGMEAVPLIEQDVVRNSSLLPAAQEFLLRFNRVFERDRNRRRPPWISDFLGTHFRGQGRLPRRAEAQAFCAAFAEGNERIRSGYFPERASLFSDDFSRYPVEEAPPVTDAEVLDVAMALVTHLSEQPPGRGARAGHAAQAAAAASATRTGAVPSSVAEMPDVPPPARVGRPRQGRASMDRAVVMSSERDELLRTLEADPTDLRALRRFIRLAHEPGDQALAREFLDRAAKAAPDRRIIRLLSGRVGAAAAPEATDESGG